MGKGATTSFIQSRSTTKKNQARARNKKTGKYHPSKLVRVSDNCRRKKSFRARYA